MASYLVVPAVVLRPLSHLALAFVVCLAPMAPVAAAGLPIPGSTRPFPQEDRPDDPHEDRNTEAGRATETIDPGSADPRSADLPWSLRLEAELVRLAARTRDGQGVDHDLPSVAPQLAMRLSSLAVRLADRAKVGIAVSDLSTGEVLFAHRADEAFNPASNQKLLTATAALELLGADFRFETEVRRHGDALYLIGHGDPSLQVEDLRTLAVAVVQAGELDGVRRIVVDDSDFSQRRFGPGYDPDGPGYSYLAPSGALSLQFNTVEITVQGNAEGSPPTVTVEPACEHVIVHNGAASTSRRGSLRVTTHGHAERTVVAVGGKIRRGRTVQLRRRITDPGRFTATAFAQMLAEATQTEPLAVQRGQAPADARSVTTHRSAPLPEVLASALKYSNNFTTEQVLRTLGHLHSGEPGDWDNGRAVLQRFWTAIGQDPAGLVIENGAGMSQRGRVSPRALVELLALVADEQTEAATVVQVMPVAGVEGTLRRRLRRTAGRVRAKTGTLSGASALTGVISDHTGRPRLGFSVLVNGRISSRTARRLQDRVVLALLAHLEA